jgi:small neutral amino acid transporter SnatA (MarC family)
MSDLARAAVGLLAAVAPFGAILPFRRAVREGEATALRGIAGAACLGTLVFISATAALGEPFLDWLDITPENFQMAAALLMLPQAFYLIWRSESMSILDAGGDDRMRTAALVFPVLAGPAALSAAVSYGTRFGVGTAVGAAALVLGITVVVLVASATWKWDGWVRALAMLNGALLVVIAVEMAVDGVQSV